MKCTYCAAEDHLESSCLKRTANRRWMMSAAALAFIFLGPFYTVGFLAGIIWSSAKAGFEFTSEWWPKIWRKISKEIEEETDDNEEGN